MAEIRFKTQIFTLILRLFSLCCSASPKREIEEKKDVGKGREVVVVSGCKRQKLTSRGVFQRATRWLSEPSDMSKNRTLKGT